MGGKKDRKKKSDTKDGLWMEDLQFYILFNSISVISGQCEGDNEKLCAVETKENIRFLPPAIELQTAR